MNMTCLVNTVCMCVWKFSIEELHAHVNGSISAETMEKIIHNKDLVGVDMLKLNKWIHSVKKGEKKNLDETFEMFKIMHQLVTDTDTVSMVTYDVIKEFANDNVRYLELRSTPRDVPSTGMTKQSYVEAVLQAIEKCMQENVKIIVRFLLSVDRSRGVNVAMETVQLAKQFKESSKGIVIGVDLSGNPNVGDMNDFVPVLKEAKNAGLKLALHIAERTNHVEESALLLSIPPDRIGHGTFLHPEVGGRQDLVDMTQKYNIPIETCLTSNVLGRTVPSFDKHHFKYWYDKKHPCIVCTDDKGLMLTSSSAEYIIVSNTFHFTKQQLYDISFNSIDCIFENDKIKDELRSQWETSKNFLDLQK
ncbi:adenosine deaminase-like protein isoform X2 [Anneissia japonica]|uniref:adenosine deaminase-like protein isoform X2 n=1 Tax=Anneissia japonica TaxID=1529436 RepID=UPI001425A683|nr:adenosine deaminase-like protein isoform X2 [Anneissia japonica]